ncbi:MAG TPA: hypothetical protein VFT88_09095 [Acidobacteriaceae bacterium]|nr:hypothetical protein [Acidobacteriaceae bacterium]
MNHRPLTSLLLLAALVASLPCAHAKDNNADEARKLYLAGAKALEKKDYKTAEADFSKAAGLEPANPQYQAARELMVGHRATALIEASEKARILGRSEEARSDLLLAYHLDPKNPMIAQHMDEIAADAAQPEPTLHPQDESIGPPVELVPDKGAHSFHLRTSGGELIKQVLSAYGITPTIDSSVTNGLARMDVTDVSFKDAARMVRMVTDTFFVPLDPKRVLVAKDTKQNRDKYQRLAYETVYFPGLDQKEITDMGILAHNVFGAPHATVSAADSTLSIRAPRPELAALNGTLAEMLDGHSVIQLDVRLYQIAKTKARNIGVQLPQQSTIFNIPSELRSFISQNQALVQQIISSGLARPGDLGAIALALLASGQVGGSSILSQPFAYFGGGLTLTGVTTSGITGNLAFNSSESHVIDNITMRVQDKDEATIKAGERYPIITSSYSSFGGSSLGIPGLSSAGLSSQLAALGINPAALQSSLSQTIPQVQYQDLGLTLKVKPSIQKDRTVTLNIALKITSLAGQSLNDIPILSSQEYTAITTLDQGATAMVVSALSKQDSQAVSGVPGLSELPGFQSTTNKQTQTDFSNLVIVITPHIVRMAHKQEAGRMFILPVH